MQCAICASEEEVLNQIWYAYANRLRMRDALHSAQKLVDPAMTYDQVSDHLIRHHYLQPSPPGKGLNRSLALQEALTSFPRYWFYLLLALYRAQALSEQQLYQLFYLDHSRDSVKLHEQMQADLQRMTSRSFLYRVWPDTLAHTLKFEDTGPYYFLNRQAIPLIERLEGLEPGSLPFGAYVTSAQQVQEFYLERDARFLDVIVALRASLYLREIELDGRPSIVHLAIENWLAPGQMHTELDDGEQFSPMALTGLRIESRDGSFSFLLPCWWEYDRGTDEVGEMCDEILRYARYYESDRYREQFPVLAAQDSPGPLIVVTDDSYRREEMRQALARRIGGQRVPIYLVERSSLTNDPYAESILLTPGDETGRYGLLDVVWEHNRALRETHLLTGNSHLTDPLPGTELRSIPATGDPVDLGSWSG